MVKVVAELEMVGIVHRPKFIEMIWSSHAGRMTELFRCSFIASSFLLATWQKELGHLWQMLEVGSLYGLQVYE